MGALEIYQKKKGKKIEISFSVLVDEDQAPSAVNTIRRKLTAIDMKPQTPPDPNTPIVRNSMIPMAG